VSRGGWLRALAGAWLFAVAVAANAGGPRWVAGQPFFYAPGWLVMWYTDYPQYYTDSGDLSPYVDHAAADAMVDAVANVWNVPTSRLVLSRGGTLDEDVSSANVYASSTGIVFPADVQPSSYASKQIAVIYDRDGSVTDMLLGAGAGNPSSCRQNAVTESVDSFANGARILHALLVLNGRCTGPAPEQQLQMQYQLMRAFGRILGVGWSQTNDNVFTGNPRPTYQQALHWPIMHPIDVICGPYTYQCMPNPFTLRDDDISGLDLLYENPFGYPRPAGRVDTLGAANRVEGNLTFPNGQGMQGVNVVVHRLEPFWDYPEEWESVSSVSGYMFRRRDGNPVSGPLSGPPTIGMGSTDPTYEGFFSLFRIPLYDWEVWQNLVISTQPINPLYIGAYTVGPYDVSAVLPSGGTNTQRAWVMANYGVFTYTAAVSDAAGQCNSSSDGTETSPAPVPSTGWWTSNLCSYGHAAWSSLTVRPNRSFTLEVTALDEQGLSTTTKMLPVTGLWSATDAAGTLPGIAAAPTAFNSSVSGMTALRAGVGSAAQSRQLRMVIADQRGDGRPDYGYRARVFYADTVSPSTLPSFGGTIAITGMGFRPGNTVTINGMAATVTGWTGNTITAVAPALHTGNAVQADVAVTDLVTGATTIMTAALGYAAPQPTLQLVSAPSGQIFTAATAAIPFAVRALAADGVTPLAGITVSLSATAGQIRFAACAASACTLTTDAQGRIATLVTALAPGPIQISAASSIGTVTADCTAVDRVQTVIALTPDLYLATQAQVAWPAEVQLSDNGGPTTGVAVQWTPGADTMRPGTGVSLTDGNSIATTTIQAGPLLAGQTAAASACAWTAVCSSLLAHGVGPGEWALEPVSGAAQQVVAGATLQPVTLRVVDSQGHPIAGAQVNVYQALEPWQLPCEGAGRCPISPVYAVSSLSLASAIDGTVIIAPLDLPGEAVVSRIAAASGTGGFISLSLVRQP
jgi:hypothetical protein